MIEQRPWTDSARTYEVDVESVASESASAAVYRAVAAVADRKPENLEPLGRTIDVDALDALLDGPGAETACRVTFRYQGYAVEVVADETIRLTPLSDEA
ncbi:HalOD1 output domain-containing protein [Halosimplex sp. J119]